MNNFEPKYLKIASKYLDDKMKSANVNNKNHYKLEDKKSSTLQRVVSALFK